MKRILADLLLPGAPPLLPAPSYMEWSARVARYGLTRSCRRPWRFNLVNPDQAVMPHISLRIISDPGTAVPRPAFIEAIPGSFRQPQRRRVVWIDLQPDPLQTGILVSPLRDSPNAAEPETTPTLIRANPIRELRSLHTTWHEADRGDKP